MNLEQLYGVDRNFLEAALLARDFDLLAVFLVLEDDLDLGWFAC